MTAASSRLISLRRWPALALVSLVRAYRFFLSPWLGSSCRFEPTCSAYSLQALERHGALAGSYLTARRLVRCAPWCPGGHDPVPDQPWVLFSRLHASGTPGTLHPTPSTDKTSP